MDLRELLSHLTDPEKEKLFYSGQGGRYILLNEYIEWLEKAALGAERRGEALPTPLVALIDLLSEIHEETEGSLSAVYNEGATTYLDRRTGEVVENPFERWRDYVASNPKWRRAIELAREASASLT